MFWLVTTKALTPPQGSSRTAVFKGGGPPGPQCRDERLGSQDRYHSLQLDRSRSLGVVPYRRDPRPRAASPDIPPCFCSQKLTGKHSVRAWKPSLLVDQRPSSAIIAAQDRNRRFFYFIRIDDPVLVKCRIPPLDKCWRIQDCIHVRTCLVGHRDVVGI